MLGATVLGARLAASSDDTVEYWSVSDDIAAGDPVTRSLLEPTRIRLAGAAGDAYLRTDEEFAAPLADLVWAHSLTPGSLVSKSSLVTRDSTTRGQLPLSVTAGAAPTDLQTGDVVDVWVGPSGESSGKTVRVLERVRVVESGGDAAALGGSLAQTVLVDVDESQLDESIIGTVSAGHVTLVRVS